MTQKTSKNKSNQQINTTKELIKLGSILLSGVLFVAVLSVVILIWGESDNMMPREEVNTPKKEKVEKVEKTIADDSKPAKTKSKKDKKKKAEPAKKSKSEGQLVAYPGRTFDYGSKFNDNNDTHLSIASEKGLSAPLKDMKDVDKNKKRLVKIKTNKNYVVDDLEYSLPYLTKGSAKELDAIAADFSDILKRNNLPHYRFVVTSVLRTEESVRDLQKSGNINATTNSAHCYGTTFDITYKRFDKNDKSKDYMSEENLKLVLGQALLNEQRAGNIYVKYEVKQACFHVTSRR